MNAIELVLPLLELVMSAGIEVQITEVWLSIMEDKVVRPGRMDEYMEQRFEAMNGGRKFHETDLHITGSYNAEMIMGVELAVKDRLSEKQLEKAQQFFLTWFIREQDVLRERWFHYKNNLLRTAEVE